jgi:hypothetical protein
LIALGIKRATFSRNLQDEILNFRLALALG